jgi:hypothetical protein
MISDEKNFLLTTQQLAGTESINTTRLLILNSAQASTKFGQSPVDLGWTIPKAHKRSYLQQKILLQKFHIWNTFKSVRDDVELTIRATDGVITRVPIFKGNWTEDTLAAYLTTKLATAEAPSDPLSPTVRSPIAVAYDPYQLAFYFCPSIEVTADSTANKYLGFHDGEVVRTNLSEFPPVALKGPTCINVWTNFTINNIPLSSYLTCIPINVPYGSHIYYDNNDNSEAVLSLDSELRFVRLTLRDEEGNLLDYPDNLRWEAHLGLQATVPDGFSPLTV